MATFDYVARDLDGGEVAGRQRADDALGLDRALERRGLTLIACTESRRPQRAGGLRRRELVQLTAQLATMIAAGVRVVDALDELAQRQTRPAARRLVAGLARELRSGRSLSQALDRSPHAFPDDYRASVRAAEASGALAEVLRRLARHLRWSAGLRATAVQASVYPLILMAASTLLVLVLLTFVIPRIVGLFPGEHHELPAETRFVLGVSELLVRNAPWLALAAGALVAGLSVLRARPAGRARLGRLWLRAPWIGALVRQLGASRFAATASLLHRAGCDVYTVLRVAGQSCGNAGLASSFGRVADLVRRGRTISQGLAAEPDVDPLLVQLVGVGESTGALEHCLERAVEHYDEELPRAVKRTVSIVEPLLLLVVGAVVALILMAAVLPLFEVYGTL